VHDEREEKAMLNFKGKRWVREGNAYRLAGTRFKIYQWNSGKNANFLIEETGKGTITVHGKGETARDWAIRKVFEMMEDYKCTTNTLC
jgi:hypothetical protein